VNASVARMPVSGVKLPPPLSVKPSRAPRVLNHTTRPVSNHNCVL
jgi:hypothetical protein